MEAYRHDAATEVETMRATLEAYAAGKIDLKKFGMGNRGTIRKLDTSQGLKAYTIEALEKFLGWPES